MIEEAPIKQLSNFGAIIDKFSLKEKGQPIKPKPLMFETDKFQVNTSKDCGQQYSNIYVMRYERLKSRFQTCNYNKSVTRIDKIEKLQQQKEQIAVVGTIYKNIRPREMQNLQGKNSEEDYFYLEDLSGRIKLDLSYITKHNICTQNLITGLVILIEGRISRINMLEVHNFFFPDLAPQPALKIDTVNEPQYLHLISGLNFDTLVDYNALCLHLQNELSQSETLESVRERNVGIVLVGNLVKTQQNANEVLNGALSKSEDLKDHYQKTEQAWSDFDVFTSTLAKMIPLYIMPGPNDPTSNLIPQRKFFAAQFYLTSKLGKNLSLLTNPTELDFKGRKIIGTSGQNLDDVLTYLSDVNEDTPVQVMEDMIKWGNIAPTAPDTLRCQPMKSSDPFVLDTIPHVFFVGNQKKFSSKLFEMGGRKTRLFTIPEYSSTKQFVTLNLQNLECKVSQLV